jgi:hypothetical protein
VLEIQQMAKRDEAGKPTKRYVYNISKLSQEEMRDVGEQVRRDGLTAIETERLTTSLPKKSGDPRGIADHQP